jgi:TRAP-type C4-dicarboxylate transport system substrate-binding protein
MTLRKAGVLLALALAATVASGCSASGGGDKAGGVAGGPAVLRMASTPSGLDDIPPVADFVNRVGALSGGTLQIKVINLWGGYAPSAEAQAVHAVASGTVDLGWAGSRVFDTLGVPGLRALSAPMLIDSYPLENAVLRSGLPGRMLAGLSTAGVTGLGVFGERLRLPFSARQPLLVPADWRGVSFGTYRSGVQEQAIQALGATPVVAFGPYRTHDLASGQIQGFELDIRRYVTDVGPAGPLYVTANVALWPQFDVLIANPHLLASLTAQQRGWLQQAARDAAGDSVALAASGDAAYIGQACAIGARFVTATPADLAALRRALAVVYQNLETDPQTRAFIQQIQRLKTATPPGPALRIPASCTRAP